MTDAPTVIALAQSKGLTLGTAESLTGGLVAAELVSVPGASAVFRGGIVAYDSMVKHDVLGVDAAGLASEGAARADVAAQMAEGALSRLGVDIVVATTGVAGPDPDPVSGARPGTAFIAVAGGPLGTMVRELRVEGDRAEIRSRTCRAALQALWDALDSGE